MEETTFPAHVNDPIERIRHQQNIRIAIAEELSLTDQWRFRNAIFSRNPKKMKPRKLIGRLIAL